MTLEDSFYIGYITKTKGLKGEVQVYFEYPEPGALDLDNVFIDLNGKLIPFFISSAKIHSNQTGNIFFDDVDSIEKAQALVRKKIYQPVAKKPAREEEEFLYSDLKGFIVFDEHYGELGEIIEVHEYPQQFIAVVPYKFREVMFPLNDEIIREINEEKGTLAVTLPDGLVDIYLG